MYQLFFSSASLLGHTWNLGDINNSIHHHRLSFNSTDRSWSIRARMRYRRASIFRRSPSGGWSGQALWTLLLYSKQYGLCNARMYSPCGWMWANFRARGVLSSPVPMWLSCSNYRLIDNLCWPDNHHYEFSVGHFYSTCQWLFPWWRILCRWLSNLVTPTFPLWALLLYEGRSKSRLQVTFLWFM